MPSLKPSNDWTLSLAIRFLAADMVQKAKSGHPGMPLGMADVATVLFKDFLRFNPNDPNWSNRDRFILSAGHGSALQYALLYLTGYQDMTKHELENFRQLGSKTPGHPEYGIAQGIETTTGPLGQGLANSVGMSLAEAIFNARFGNELVNHKTYVICGDGCLMEGISQEAISLAGHLGLKNLILLFDDNEISIDGSTSLATSDDHMMRFQASNWNTYKINGHDYAEIFDVLKQAQSSTKPVFIACKTTIGFGAPTKAGTHHVHGSALGEQEINLMREKLNWSYPPFEIPSEVLNAWRNFWKRNEANHNAWQKIYKSSGQALKEYHQDVNKTKLAEIINKIKQDFIVNLQSEATRQSSGRVLSYLVKELPSLIGGSADLTGSNNTYVASQKVITKEDYTGSYIHYGVREHAMGAVMNGLSLYGGIIPYGGTFLTFTDYARPAIRLSALMKQRVVYVMTHDSIGLGEDGPTHQPVEHLAALRAIPNLYVYRPADAIETAECWELALANEHSPAILALSRQNLKPIRTSVDQINKCARGAYIIREAQNELKVTIFATGSEVEIAHTTAELLENNGQGVRVVSVPCMDLFFEQDMEYQMSFTCNKSLKVAIEAGVAQGWERLIGPHGMFFGVNTFGESAPYKEVYEHFGLTPGKIFTEITRAIK